MKKNNRIYIILSLVFAAFFISGMATRKKVKEYHAYYHANDVVLYLDKYHELPPNYINNEKLKNTGYQPGDYIYTYQTHEYRGTITTMTTKTSLIECDVDYPSDSDLRGTKRIVYSTDYEEFYYTSNHYVSFEKITPFKINIVSNILYIVAFNALGALIVCIIILERDKQKIKSNNISAVIDS